MLWYANMIFKYHELPGMHLDVIKLHENKHKATHASPELWEEQAGTEISISWGPLISAVHSLAKHLSNTHKKSKSEI